LGVVWPWSHQVEAAERAWAGRHVVVSTGTSSGKSLAYLLPGLSTLAAVDAPTRGRDRTPTVLYIAPTKALAHDQLATLCDVGAGTRGLRATAVDGDTPRSERDWARDHATWVVTNPDMLHRSVLPAHARWARLLGGLTYVVVDECHHYRGVFGSHVAQVLRRLRRLAAHYGAEPTFVLASATVADPDGCASTLTGLPVEAVTEDGSPRGEGALALWETAARRGQRRARSADPAIGHRGDCRPADRPGAGRCPDAGLRALPPRRRNGRPHRGASAGRDRPVTGGLSRSRTAAATSRRTVGRWRRI
jgi:DEAD/DEAH box helicase domain-containing protein